MDGLKPLYIAYVYSYLNYPNTAWASTQKIKLTAISSH